MAEKNYFIELNSIAWEVEKKNNLSYISRATAREMLKKEHPDSNYTIYENDWFPFWESIYGIDVKVWVTVWWLEHIVRLPVMDWANNIMTQKKQQIEKEKFVYKNNQKVWDKANNCWKKEKYILTIEPATQFDINKTIQRAFTKAMAMHGIWLYVYRWEDLPNEQKENHDPIPLAKRKQFSVSNYETFKKEYKKHIGKYPTAESMIKMLSVQYILSDNAKAKIIEFYNTN